MPIDTKGTCKACECHRFWNDGDSWICTVCFTPPWDTSDECICRLPADGSLSVAARYRWEQIDELKPCSCGGLQFWFDGDFSSRATCGPPLAPFKVEFRGVLEVENVPEWLLENVCR